MELVDIKRVSRCTEQEKHTISKNYKIQNW